MISQIFAAINRDRTESLKRQLRQREEICPCGRDHGKWLRFITVLWAIALIGAAVLWWRFR